MLFERYDAEIADEAAAEGAPRIHLTSFQRDGLFRDYRLLADRHGVLIADEVGLGKTFLARELIRQAVEERPLAGARDRTPPSSTRDYAPAHSSTSPRGCWYRRPRILVL